MREKSSFIPFFAPFRQKQYESKEIRAKTRPRRRAYPPEGGASCPPAGGELAKTL